MYSARRYYPKYWILLSIIFINHSNSVSYFISLVCLMLWVKPVLTLTFPCKIQKKHHHSLNLLYYHPSVVVSFYPQFCLFLLKLMDNIWQKLQNSFILLSSFLKYYSSCVYNCVTKYIKCVWGKRPYIQRQKKSRG